MESSHSENASAQASKKVAVIGCGNWGTAIARHIAINLQNHNSKSEDILMDSTVYMYVHEESVSYNSTAMNLSEVIDTFHENPKYLPGVILPENIKAVVSLSGLEDIDIFVFCLPCEFLNTLKDLKTKKGAIGVNLSKGIFLDRTPAKSEGRFRLATPTQNISNLLGIECSSLMGANIASEVSSDIISDTTFGYQNGDNIKYFDQMLKNDRFFIEYTPYEKSIEVFGAMKNIISIGYGILSRCANEKPLGIGNNTISIFFRKGLLEIIRFMDVFGTGDKHSLEDSTVFKSCGIGDLLTSCMCGRNRKGGEIIAEYLIQRNLGGGDSAQFLEPKDSTSLIKWVEERFGGQKLQGFCTVKTFYDFVRSDTDKFPLIASIYKICHEEGSLDDLFKAISK